MPAPSRATPGANDPVEDGESAGVGINEGVEPELNPLHRSPATVATGFGSAAAVSGATAGAVASAGSAAGVAAVGEPAGTDAVAERMGALLAVDGLAAERAAAGEAEPVALSAAVRLGLVSEESAVEAVCPVWPVVWLASELLLCPAVLVAVLVDPELSCEVPLSASVPDETLVSPEPVEPPPVPLVDEPTT